MILYNTTFHIDRSIRSDFMAWVKERFIPEAVKDHALSDPMLTRILTVVEPDAETFALHLYADDRADVDRWERTSGQALLSEMFKRWGERALAFSTPMEILDT